MEKASLISFIEKYHLDGLIEKAKWSIRNGILNVGLISPNQNLLGEVYCDFKYEDVEFVVTNTSKLIKIASLTDKDINISFEKEKKIARKMTISDTTYNVDYILSDILTAPKIPKVEDFEFDLLFDITPEIVTTYCKAYKAVSSITEKVKCIITLDSINQDKNIKLTVGVKGKYSNKVEFIIKANYDDELLLTYKDLCFPAEELKILLENNKCEGKGYVSSQGLIKFNFIENGINSLYHLVADDE